MYKSVSDQILKFSNFKILRTLIFAASSIRVHLIVILVFLTCEIFYFSTIKNIKKVFQNHY